MVDARWIIHYRLLIDDYQGPIKAFVIEAPDRVIARSRAHAELMEQESAWVQSGGEASIREITQHRDPFDPTQP